MRTKRVIAFVPLPPPYAGPEIATERMLDVLSLPRDCELRVVQANVRTSNEKRGHFDWEGIYHASKSLLNLFFACLWFRPQKVYLLINPSRAGFLRDAAAIFTAKLFFCKVVGHYHGSHFRYFFESASPVYRFLIRKALRRLSKMFVQAERLKNIFSGLLPDSQIAVLYNGISDDCLNRGLRALHSKKGRTKDFVTFLFFGHISFTKGFYELMTACKKLVEQRKRLRLLVGGDFILNLKTQSEFLEEPYRKFYKDRHLEMHREMVDFVQGKPPRGIECYPVVTGEKKHLLFEQADVLVLPSYSEGFPNVILEAMAFGLGLIVTPVGALPEILKEPDNALFVERGNAQSLSGQMDRLVSSPSLRFQMGSNNRVLVEERYRMQFTARRFERVVFDLGILKT